MDLIFHEHQFVWQRYYEASDLRASTILMKWVLQNYKNGHANARELLAPLDQLNAYTLPLSMIVPDSLRGELKYKVGILAHNIKDNFYGPEFNKFWGSPGQQPFTGVMDFSHSIKSIWMIYTVVKQIDDKALEPFAREGAEQLLETAFHEESGSWALN